MVVYYLNKVSERLADYRYPIKEGDICMLYDGDAVKTIYVDSETEADSIWRDFKFIDSKSLKSYHLPKTDSVLCAPVGSKHAIGDTSLLTQLIQECKGEWLLDFLNETSAVLSGFVDYWDLMVLRRLTGDDDIEIAYGDEEALSAFIDEPDEDEYDEEELEDDDEEEYTDVDILPKSYDIKWFCLSALSCIEDQMDKRSYQILYDTLNGEPRSEIASRFHLTQERIRQIVVKATKQAKELLIEQRKNLEETKEENAKLKVQMKLLREDIAGLKKLVPQNVFIYKSEEGDIDAELTELLETPLKEINLPARATNILMFMKVDKFADIPQIESSMKLLEVRNSGRKTLLDVSHLLEDFHLYFGMSLTEIIDVLKKTDWHDAKRKWIEGSEEEEEEVYVDEDESYETVDDDKEDDDDSSLTDDIDTEEEPDDAEEASLDDLEVEHVFVDSSGRWIDSFTTNSASLKKGSSTENRRGKPWTEEEEDALRTFFNQGRDTATIAAIMGRTEVAIKSRLGMMGLIDYSYGQDEVAKAEADKDEQEKEDESSFTVENSFTKCYIVNRRGDRVFMENGKLKYIGGKLYRMNRKHECFTLKRMMFNGSVWSKGEKKIVAYPQTPLYRVLDTAIDYCDLVEEITDRPVFEECKLKVNGVWYRYDGNPDVTVASDKDGEEDMSRKTLRILKSPLYAVRRQAVLRAMGYFRQPAKIIDIVRTISRTAWGDVVREDDVEDLISTMDEIESVDGKYVLRKR